MDSEHKSFILKNYSEIADVLDSGDDLIYEMLSRQCLTVNQLIIIENTSDRCERNKKLLDFLLRSSRATLKLFIGCLEVTQCHLVPLITEKTGDLAFSYINIERMSFYYYNYIAWNKSLLNKFGNISYLTLLISSHLT